MKLHAKIAFVTGALALSFASFTTSNFPGATIQHTTIPLGEASPEAFVAQGGLYRALNLIETQKSYGEKYANIVREIKNSTALETENQHPYMTLADTSLGEVHKKISATTKDIPQEAIIGMIKKAIDEQYLLFKAAKKDEKIK
jgi:hypothetical protein